MGVRGLARYCFQQEAQTSYAVSPLRGVTLAVDFVGFQFFVCQELLAEHERERATSASTTTGQSLPGSLWLLLGGCPLRLDRFVSAWLARMAAADIRLLFVTDPPQCFMGRDHGKADEWRDRRQHKADKMQQLRDALFELLPATSANGATTTFSTGVTRCRLNADQQSLMRRHLQDTQGCFLFAREALRAVLQRHGMTVTTSVGEADEALGELVRNGQAFAVLGNDSDFICMRGVRYIPFAKLRLEPRISSHQPLRDTGTGTGTSTLGTHGGGVVHARVFTPELVVSALQLTSSQQLVDVALLCTNDVTQPLDAQFQLARLLNFPRTGDGDDNDTVSPELAARWIQGQAVTPLLEDPRLASFVPRYDGLSAALYAIYRFYGYGDEFHTRFPIANRSHAGALGLAQQDRDYYLALLDRDGYTTSLIDVLAWQSRSLAPRFDLLAVVAPKQSTVDLLMPARRLLYQALGVTSVREGFHDFATGELKQVEVMAPPLPFLTSYLAAVKGKQVISGKKMDTAWQSLVLKDMMGPSQRGKAATIWKMMGARSHSTKNLVASLLVLAKCDEMYAAKRAHDDETIPALAPENSVSSGNQQKKTKKQKAKAKTKIATTVGINTGHRQQLLLTKQRLELLLLTAMLCMWMEDSQCAPPFEFTPADLTVAWPLIPAANAFLEVLRIMYYVRIALREHAVAQRTTTTSVNELRNVSYFFSSEVFFTVYAITSRMTRTNTPSMENKASLTREQVHAVLNHFHAAATKEDHSKRWLQYCQLRAIVHRMIALSSPTPSGPPAIVASSPPVGTHVVTDVGESVDNESSMKENTKEEKRKIKKSKKREMGGGGEETNTHSLGSNGQVVRQADVGAALDATTSMMEQLSVNGLNDLTSSVSVASDQVSRSSNGSKINDQPQATLSKKAKAKAKRKAKLEAKKELQRNGDGAAATSVPSDHPLPPLAPPLLPSYSPTNGATMSDENVLAAQAGSTKKKKGRASLSLLTPASVAKRMPSKTGAASVLPTSDSPPISPPTTPSPAASSTSLAGLMETLPVFAHRAQILKNVASNQLTIIQGETGCGKSTSVPQFILDEWQRGEAGTSETRPMSIYVTQPRRIAAIELAKTVARMREGNDFGEDGTVGGVIGYRIGQKHCISSKTKISYVTTGYMVERLIHDPDALKSMTHLVIDEVHERSMDVDSLLLLLRLQLQHHEHLRLIIMSATMDAKVLIKYFSKAMATRLVNRQPLFVGSKLFPVDNIYLDALVERYPALVDKHRSDLVRMFDAFKRVINSQASSNGELGLSILQNVHEFQLKLMPTLIQLLIGEHHRGGNSTHNTPQCILIFLPGIGAINRLYEELRALFPVPWYGITVSISVLHSSLELEQQQAAFTSLSGHTTKVVLSTNIAESSVTIPDVTHVINCGLEKQIQMPNGGITHAEVLMDVWCSQASVLQRAGRAGRVMAGTACHLFPEPFMQTCMNEFTVPELLRKPLDRIVLQLKGKLHEFGVPSALLKQALDAPDLKHIDGAYKLLAHHDAIDAQDEERAQITAFGSFVCQMPVSMELCRLLLAGTALVSQPPTTSSEEPTVVPSRQVRPFTLANIVILVALMASPDLFVMPSWYHLHSAIKYMDAMKENLHAKMTVDGGLWSEPLAMWKFYMTVMAKHTVSAYRPHIGGILKAHGMSVRRWQALNLLISDLSERFVAMARQGAVRLDRPSIDMLRRLERYASSQTVDATMVRYAKTMINPAAPPSPPLPSGSIRGSLSGSSYLEALRFLLIHTYSEFLVSGRPSEGGHFDEDADISETTDRVDLALNKEHKRDFKFLTNQDRKTMLSKLLRVASKSVKATDKFVSVAYTEEQISLYAMHEDKTQPSSTDGETEIQERGDMYEHVLQRMSFPISLVYYIRDPKFPVDFGHLSSQDGEEQNFRFRVKGCSGSTVAWTQSKDGVKVNVGGRSLFALPIRPMEDDEAGPPATSKSKSSKRNNTLQGPRLLAVYGDRLFTGDETRMFCSKWTLLPPDVRIYHAVLLLTSARLGDNVWLQADRHTGDIMLIRVNQQVIDLPTGLVLRGDLLDRVNVVRAALSAALQCNNTTPSDVLNAPSHEMPEVPLLPIESILELCRDENMIFHLSKQQLRASELEWRQVVMVPPSNEEQAVLREHHHTSPRYPTLY